MGVTKEDNEILQKCNYEEAGIIMVLHAVVVNEPAVIVRKYTNVLLFIYFSHWDS